MNSESLSANDTVNLPEASHSVHRICEGDVNLQKRLGCLGTKLVPSSSALEVLDDILFQPTATIGRVAGKFQLKPVVRPKDKKATMLPSVLRDVTQSDPLLVNSQLLSPQGDELEKGSAQLTASCNEASGEVADPPLEVAVAVACADENTQAEDGSLGREEEAAFSGLESLDDIFFQPSATTVGGGSKFRPKPSSCLKKKSVIALPSSLPKAVDSVSLQILSPQIEGLEMGSASIKATFTRNGSTEVSSSDLHDSAPTDVYPEFLATQEAADPNDASHSGEVFGANVVFQNVHENNSLGKEVPVTFPDMESVDDVHFQSDTIAGNFQPKPINQLESKENVGPAFVHPKVMESVSPQIEGSEESIHSTLLDGAVVEPSTSISCSFSQTDFSSQLPFSQEPADLVDTPCSTAAGFRDFQMDTGSSRNEATVASCGLEALDDVLFQPATATVRGVGKFRPKPKGRTTNTEPQANINPPDDMKPVSVPRNALILPCQTECLEVVSLDAFVDSSTVDSTHTFSIHGSQEPANHYVVPNLEACFPGGDMELENVPETLEKEVTGASSGLDALNDVLFQPATATVTRESKIRSRSKDQIANTEPLTSIIPSDDMEQVYAPMNASILPSETECLEEVSPDDFVDAAAIDSTHTSSQHGSQEPADCIEVPNLEALIPGRDTDMQNVPETSGTEKTIIRKREASTISNVSREKSWSRKVNETAQDETPYSAMEGNETGPTRRLRRRTTIPEPADELQDGNHQISNSSSMNDHDADNDYRGEDEPKKKRASGAAKKSSAEKTDAGTPRKQRKRTTTHCPVDECEDGNYEVSNDSATDDNGDNDEYNGEDKSKKKKASTAAKKSAAETDKPVRRHRKASENADPANEEPPQKKFSHSTRRSRRRVNKVLLETPEEDIDPRKLVMKDLIMLAEIKERQLNKAAAAAKKSFPTQSANGSSPTDAPYEDDDPLASTQGLDHDDDQANHRAEPSVKLNYHSFMKRTPKERWSKSDTETFYEAIRQFGTDFAMIQQLFPGRTRHQVKLKYKAEERKHPLQISDALINRSKDHSHFERVLEQLQAQEQQNSNRDAETLDATARNEEAALDSEWKGEGMREDSKYEVQSPVKSHESQDTFDWSHYGSANAFSPQEMDKGEHNLF